MAHIVTGTPRKEFTRIESNSFTKNYATVLPAADLGPNIQNSVYLRFRKYYRAVFLTALMSVAGKFG
jgi:hypothetical protein